MFESANEQLAQVTYQVRGDDHTLFMCFNLILFILFVKLKALVLIYFLKVLSRLIERCVQDNEESARGLLSLLDQALVLQSTTVWKFILR